MGRAEHQRHVWFRRRHRPGWPMPIRDLAADQSRADIFPRPRPSVFAKQDYYASGATNGSPDLIYQETPQPSHYPYDSYSYATGTNFGYNYQSGVFFGSSGHLRVTVSPVNVTVEYVRPCILRPIRQPRPGRASPTDGQLQLHHSRDMDCSIAPSPPTTWFCNGRRNPG